MNIRVLDCARFETHWQPSSTCTVLCSIVYYTYVFARGDADDFSYDTLHWNPTVYVDTYTLFIYIL